MLPGDRVGFNHVTTPPNASEVRRMAGNRLLSELTAGYQAKQDRVVWDAAPIGSVKGRPGHTASMRMMELILCGEGGSLL